MFLSMEVVRVIHPFERQCHSVPQRQLAQEKLTIHLVEAHYWMGPENPTDALSEPRDLRVPAELTSP